MEFDIRTLSVISAMGCLAFAFAAFTVARLHPAESSLKAWAKGAIAAAVATFMLGLRGAIPDFLSIVMSNAILVLGTGFMHLGVRGLLGFPVPRPWPWVLTALSIVPLLWFTYLTPSVPARIIVISVLLLPSLIGSAWAFLRHDRLERNPSLRLLHRISLAIYLFGTYVFLARLGPAYITLTSDNYTVTSSALQAAPYLWAILFNVWMSIMVTITVSVRLQDELAAARDRAEAANVAKSRFLATMSHEIRTPMNGILGMAQVLQQPDMDEAERQASARTILQSGQTLMTLLNDILDLSKVEAGKFDLAPVPFEARRLAGEIETLFAESARARGLALTTHWQGAPGAERYVGDATRLRQMLSNLVGNAIKFTHAGEVRIEVGEVARDGAGATLEFAVVDTGIGLPEEKRALVFQAFSQADDTVTREYGGTGLGLSIVRSLAHLMDGEAGVESTPGVGSRFWFRVRVAVAQPGQADLSDATPASGIPAPAPSPSLPSSPPPPSPGRVLVVEDNAVNRAVVAAMLRRFGMPFLMAEDGQQGVDAVMRESDIRAVLMDVQMPVLDGYAATRRIRDWEQQAGRARLPIIALTADAYAEDRERSLAAGMDDFLSKPVHFEALRQLLERWTPTRQP